MHLTMAVELLTSEQIDPILIVNKSTRKLHSKLSKTLQLTPKL